MILGDYKNLQPYKDDATSDLTKKKSSDTGWKLIKRIRVVLRRLCCIQKIKD
ncbi:hypothetical protein DPMN_182060 [Dreissena polymorpha]|uniref:Uncharacterized protein n=2 Tax=Dreissena polymorpha TaxID=45954 RepID=A0A9D4DDH0_DREPO|nr:hypothetical protein DPMN_182060 [Dreissena polymorpha]